MQQIENPGPVNISQPFLSKGILIDWYKPKDLKFVFNQTGQALLGLIREADPGFDKYLQNKQKEKLRNKQRFEELKNDAAVLMIYIRNAAYELNSIVVEGSRKALKETVHEFKNTWGIKE